ncbi:MAG: PAS domain-containing protein [Terriglobales bacterium]
MITQTQLTVTKKLHFWPSVLVGVVAIKAVCSLTLNPSFFLAACNASVYMLLLLLAIGFALWNAEQGTGGGRTFWLFMAGGYALWAFDQGLYLYYEIGLRTDVPDSSIADPALFLHVVPLMAAVAMRPHLRQSDQKPSRATLNFLMLLFFWVFLYAYALFPYQYLFADAAVYNPRFTAFYAVENASLILALGITAFRAQPPWKSVYIHFFAASALYGISSTLANIAIDRGWHYNGSVYSLAQTAAVCWFVWVPLHASQLPLAETMSTEPDAGRAGFTSLLAKTAVIAIPLIGILELFKTHQSPGMRTFRLAVVLASVLFLTAAVFLKEHLARRDLLLDSRLSKLQKKLSEAALVTSEDRYRDLVEALPDAIFVAKEERIVFVNPSAVRLLGAQRPEQIVGKELSEIVHPESLPSVRSRVRNSYQTGIATLPWNTSFLHSMAHWCK